jgi:hypothetical protein
MLPLVAVVPEKCMDVLAVIELLGATDRERAERLGISRPQVTNILNKQLGPCTMVHAT